MGCCSCATYGSWPRHASHGPRSSDASHAKHADAWHASLAWDVTWNAGLAAADARDDAATDTSANVANEPTAASSDANDDAGSDAADADDDANGWADAWWATAADGGLPSDSAWTGQ